MTQVHCWILIGNQGVRKGSLIRSMTGIDRRTNDCDVMLAQGQSLRFRTAVMSANEGERALDPGEWVNSLTPLPVGGAISARLNVLAALRFTMGAAGKDAKDYIDSLAIAGAVLESIVTLGEVTPDWVRSYGAPYAHIENVDVPTNALAAQVREFWGWR